MNEELTFWDLQRLITIIRIETGVLARNGIAQDEITLKLQEKLTRIAAAKAAAIGFAYPQEDKP